MRYQVETYGECVHDIEKLMEGQWGTVHAFTDKLDRDINYDRYRMLSDHGYLRAVTVRDDAGVLRGVCVWLLFEDPDHKGTLGANAYHFYIDPEIRGHMAASRLISESEALLRRTGVKMMGICVKNQDEFLPLVKRHGFDRPQTTWYKWIGD